MPSITISRVGINRADRGDSPAHDLLMNVACEAEIADGGRLIEQVKADLVVGNAFEALGELLPQKDESVLCLLIAPQIMLFKVVAVDAVTGCAVQIQIHVQPALLARRQIPIQISENALIRLEVAKIRCPEPVIAGDTYEVKAACRDKIERAFVGRLRRLARIAKHPQEVKTVSRHGSLAYLREQTLPLGGAAIRQPPDRVAPVMPDLRRFAHRRLVDLDPQTRAQSAA